ncbi:protein TonB [Dysgonomonas sp. PFB1-18]|uniref:energy transducer TonB n=1 Tax=unclassified Dysgonomonas TaxID=2630389 RepID=UPI002476C1E0|nr:MULTISPECIES: energy transducer TonB [unclassified Dysgonomonas]MDH6308348.1 protein TonB [Dysgonomonas sp. PF1-14]MDH6338215.1 protein TonB [Dysgonomonas sp. PF1-16]MDH6379712.1 protein TonB [Dysgonomonas sp. PFB1-18]MDH6397199.1 protein TonB [Dysgonomonas sp. PF1-23]
MSKDIRLNSAEWCDVVFEGKNKEYGAYKLRQSSSKRHIVAFLVVLVFAGFVSALPGLVSVVKNLTQSDVGPMDEAYEMSKIPVEQEIPEENIIKQETAPPPPPLKTTVKFVPPTIAKDEEVVEDKMVGQEQIQETKIQISVADVKGTDDKHGIDIAELREHKQIVEEKPVEEKPFVTVEQMPSFPGGEAEMQRFIAENLKYPVVAQESGIQGRVTIRFVVTKTGDISDVQVIRGIDPSCDKEARRVVSLMPKWIPGKQNGLNVPVYFTLPIVFRLKQ